MQASWKKRFCKFALFSSFPYREKKTLEILEKDWNYWLLVILKNYFWKKIQKELVQKHFASKEKTY